MAGNKSLKAAVRAKEDEFYTQLTDIESRSHRAQASGAGQAQSHLRQELCG